MSAAKPSLPRLMRSKPLAQSLVGAWPLYEGGGLTANDLEVAASRGSAGQGWYGILTGGVSWAGGQFGSCLQFNGTTGYINLNASGNSILDVAGPYTWSIWWNAATGSSGTRTLVSKHTSGANANYLVWLATNGSMAYFCSTTGQIVGVATPALSVWHHTALVWDGSRLTGYLDGIIDAQSSAVGGTPVTTIQDVRIGASSGGSNWFNGLIDSAVLWNRALSSAEVVALYADTFQMFRPSRTILKAAAAPAGAAKQLLSCLGCGA